MREMQGRDGDISGGELGSGWPMAAAVVTMGAAIALHGADQARLGRWADALLAGTALVTVLAAYNYGRDRGLRAGLPSRCR